MNSQKRPSATYLFAMLAALALCLPATLAAEENSADLFADIAAPAVGNATGGTASGDDGSAPSLRLSGEASLTLPFPADPDNWSYGSEARSPAFGNLVGMEYRLGEVKLVSEWNAGLSGYYPIQKQASAVQSAWEGILQLKPGENYLSWTPGRFRLDFGYRVFSWGSADGRNPTDNLNPRDYAAGVESPKIPVLAGSVSWYPTDNVSAEAVYVPREQADIFPSDAAAAIPDTAFFGSDLKLSGAQVAALGASLAVTPPIQQPLVVAQYLYMNSSAIERVPVSFARSVSVIPLANDPSAFLAGGKVNLHGPALDASVSYLYDIDPFLTPTIATAAYAIMETGFPLGATGASFYRISDIKLARGRIHRLGLDLKGSIGPVGLWLESAWSQPHDWVKGSYAVRSPGLSSIVGFDSNWGPGNAFYANAQGLVQWYPWYDKSFGADYPNGQPVAAKISDKDYMTNYYYRAFTQKLGGQTEGLSLGATLALQFPLGGDLVTPTLAAAFVAPLLYDDSSVTRLGSLVLSPEIDVMPIDSLHILAGARLCYAWAKTSGGAVALDRSGDGVGTYTKDNQVYLTVKYAWNQNVGR